MTADFTIAVHALVYLNYKKKFLSSELLAENICTNPATVRKVMAKLKKSGLVVTKEGIDGGYFFGADPEQINLEQICEAMGLPIVTSSWNSGNPDMQCLVASGMAGIINGIYTDLDTLCRQRLSKITIHQIDQQIFDR